MCKILIILIKLIPIIFINSTDIYDYDHYYLYTENFK